jgi:hypothetical protein
MGTTDDLFGSQGAPELPASEPEPEEERKAPVKASPEAQAEEVKGPKPYTPEELTELISSDGTVDVKRLSAEGQALMKSFQRGFTPKLEKVAQLERELAELKKKAEPEKAKTWDDYYETDPDNTLLYIDNQIAVKEQELDAFDYAGDSENARAKRKEIREWERLKSGLVTKNARKIEKELKAERDTLKKKTSIDGYDSKFNLAKDYLINVSKMSSDKAEKILDDVEMINLFSSLNVKEKAPDTVKDKQVKKAPAQLGRPGASKEQEKAPDEDFDYGAEFEKARKTGNWLKILEHKGAL